MIFERVEDSEPRNSMYVVRGPKFMGLSAQRPIRVGTLFEDPLNKSRRIKSFTLTLLDFHDISMKMPSPTL